MQFYRPYSVYQKAREFVEQKDLTHLPFFMLRKQSQYTSYVSRAHLVGIFWCCRSCGCLGMLLCGYYLVSFQ